MSELNREQVIKALECCVEEDCNNCPCHKNGIIGCHITRNKNVLSLIKELTQANEQLSESYDHLEKTKDELIAERSRLSIDLKAMRGAANAYKMQLVEITEEKDTWEEIAKSYQKQFEDCAEDRAKLTEENEKIGIDNFNLICELSRIKEDTVRKMVEGLDKHFYHDHAFRGVELRLIMDIIGRVVKEMLEDST